MGGGGTVGTDPLDALGAGAQKASGVGVTSPSRSRSRSRLCAASAHPPAIEA